MDEKVDSKGIINTSVKPWEFLDQIHEMMNLKVEDEKQGVEFLG